MLRTSLLYMFVVLGSINLFHLAMYVIGANIYDIQQFRTAKIPKQRFGGAKKLAPKVSIIIPAYNESLTIERCLDSIRRNTYRKVEVIVHNDRSRDDTAKLVREFKQRHPHMQIRLITRRKNVGKGAGLNYSIKRYATGSLIMTLDADCILERHAIKRAVDHFKNPRVVGVAANVRIMHHPSIVGVLQKFEHLVGYRTKKFYTVSNCEFIVGGVASTYRRDVLQAVGMYDTDTQTEDIGLSIKIAFAGNQQQRIIYAADVVAMTEPVMTFRGLLTQRYRWKLGMIQNLLKYKRLAGNMHRKYSKTLTWYRIPMAFISELLLLFEPFLLGYLLYLSFAYHTVSLFIGAYVMLTIYVLLTIWPDEHASVLEKIKMTAVAPFLYFVFYIMDVVQIVAIFRVIAKPKKALLKSEVSSTWISPQRMGTRTT